MKRSHRSLDGVTRMEAFCRGRSDGFPVSLYAFQAKRGSWADGRCGSFCRAAWACRAVLSCSAAQASWINNDELNAVSYALSTWMMRVWCREYVCGNMVLAAGLRVTRLLWRWGDSICTNTNQMLRRYEHQPDVAALRWNMRRVSWEGGEGWVGISWSLPVSRCWVSLFLDLDYLRRKMGRPWCPFSRWDPECDLILLCCHTTLAAVFCYWTEIEKMELDVETWFPSFHGSYFTDAG